MQRNFELTQELLKCKDSQKILERIFFMFLNNFGNSGCSQEALMSIFPGMMRSRELKAPPSNDDRFENQS